MYRVTERFFRASDGNIALMFALALIPLLAAAGAGIDMLRAGQMRAQIAQAADAGLLAAARARELDPSLTQTQAEAVARRVFDANNTSSSGFIVSQFRLLNPGGGNEYKLDLTGSIETQLIRVVGVDTIDWSLSSEAKVSPPRDLEVALILDNTYSMTGSKLAALKTAATSLVNAVMADTSNTVKVGVVPFSQYVNVGMSRRDDAWIDVPDDYSTTTQYCRNTYPDRTRTNCITTQETCSRTRDGITTTWTCDRTRCDVDNGDPVWVCSDRTQNYTWRGCAGSRSSPLNAEDRDYGASPVPGLLNIDCPQEIRPLTTNKANILADINSMSVQGSQTYIPTGFKFGYRLLSPDEPFTEGVPYADMARDRSIKAIVLMTDGANTKSQNNAYHNGSGASGANNLLDNQCNEAKSDGIRVYTIAFNVSDTAIRTLLEDCATGSDYYYDATDAAALSAAFQAIGASLYELALTR